MMGQPKDFDPNQTDPNYRQQWHGGSAISGKSRGGQEGRDKRIDYLLQSLILAGIFGLVGVTLNLKDNVTEIKTFVTTKASEYEREFTRIDKTLDRHNDRLTALEQGRRAGNRQPDYRQER
jgi:hypothetical protein